MLLVSVPSRTSTEIQVERKMTIFDVMRMAPEILGVKTIRYQAIVNNTGIFFFAFELCFNRWIQKAKEFFPNIDPNILTLIDMDAQFLIDEVLRGDPYTFIDIVGAALDVGLEMTTFSLPVEDDPLLRALKMRRIKVLVCSL